MAVNIGSMAIMAKFNSSAITTGISNIKTKFKSTTLSTKFLNSQLLRLKGTFKKIKTISLAAGAGLLGTIMAAVMKSPLLAGELEQLKIEFELLGNVIAKYVKPVLRWIVKALRWLRNKFQDLPQPIQDVIGKAIVFGSIIFGLIIVASLFVIGLAAVTTALGILFPAGVIASVVAFGAAIWGVIAGSLILAGILGLILGILGVFVLDKLGILDWISDVGAGFRNWDSIIRDVIATTVGFIALIGAVAIDIGRGDFEFSTYKDWSAKRKEAQGRTIDYFKGEYEYGKGSTLDSAWEAPIAEEMTSKIEKQENNIVINAGNLEGAITDPEVMKELSELLGEQLALAQTRESI